MLESQARIDQIEASFERVKLHKSEFSAAFYSRLFAKYPELEPLFMRTDINRQGTKLYAALVLLVENLRHPVELERVLLPLGEKHIGYGATAEAFPKVGGTIIATLREFLGEDWTPELEDAWRYTLQAVTETMLRGAGMSLPTESVLSEFRFATVPEEEGHDAVVQLVQESFAKVNYDQSAFTAAFYQELFDRSPHLRPLFEQVDIRRQGAKLQAALVLLVENLKRPDELERILIPLGKKHLGYGATADNYPLVGGALLATLGKFLGDAWTGEVAAAWSETLAGVTTLMLRGAESGDVVSRDKSTNDTGRKNVAVESTADGSRKRVKSVGRGSRRRGIAHRFAQWFYSAPLSTIVGVWALIGASLISLSFIFPEIRGVVVFANPLSLLLALFLYIRETPERKKQFHYHAWSTIDHAAHVKTSNARFLALQDLCADGISLKGLTLEGVDLKGIDLANAELGSSALRACNLSGANLCDADLNNADLGKANLSGSLLAGANLGFVKLGSANCSSADLSGANLMFADLSNTNLSGANLTGARLSGASFDGAYLSGANLQETDISVADLDGAFLVGALMPDGTLGQ